MQEEVGSLEAWPGRRPCCLDQFPQSVCFPAAPAGEESTPASRHAALCSHRSGDHRLNPQTTINILPFPVVGIVDKAFATVTEGDWLRTFNKRGDGIKLHGTISFGRLDLLETEVLG